MELRESTIPRIERRYERERRARLEAEAIAEQALSVLYHKQAELLLLQQITVAANEARSPETAYRKALDLVCMHTGWPVGHVYLVANGGELVSSAIWYLGDEKRFQPFRTATENTRLSLGRGLPGRVYRTAKPAWITDVNCDDDFPRREGTADLPVRAGLAFPIKAGLEVVAVAEFFSPDAIEPDESLLELVNHNRHATRPSRRTRECSNETRARRSS